jgi:hypothetical protein
MNLGKRGLGPHTNLELILAACRFFQPLARNIPG